MAEATIIKVRTDRFLMETMVRHYTQEKRHSIYALPTIVFYAVAVKDGRLAG